MAFTNRIRLPFKLTRAQFPETKSVYRKADGTSKTLSVVIQKTYEGETDWMAEKWHERLAIALGHDNVSYEGDKYLGGISKDGDYSIDWQTFLDYPTAKAKFSVQVTPFDATNSNCQTCEEALQLSLADDTFPGTLEQDTDYFINVYDNDTVCCYPAAFSITSYDTDYIETTEIDQEGNLIIHTKASFASGNGIKLLTYRVTCPNGGFDEADVFGDLEGDVPGCLAPSDIVITAITATSAAVSFTASPSTPDHYLWRLYKASAPGVLVQTGTSTTTFTLTGLDADTEYILYVRSQCGPGNDDASASNFIDTDFTTANNTSMCGSYTATFTDLSGDRPPPASVTYLNCSGSYVTTHIGNFQSKTFCALQTTPGTFVSITSTSPYISIHYNGLC